MLSFKAVVFDMDGVLCDSEEFMAAAGSAMFRETYGMDVHPGDFLPFVGTGEDRYLGGVAEKYKIGLTMPRDKEKAYDIYLDAIRGHMQPLPGVLGFVAYLKTQSLLTAVATSADRRKAIGNLAEIGLPETSFDACITGSDITHKKPHPEIFLTAVEALGTVASHTLVVEDAVSGVQAAKAAGCYCLALSTSFSPEELLAAGADSIAESFEHLPEDISSRLTRQAEPGMRNGQAGMPDLPAADSATGST